MTRRILTSIAAALTVAGALAAAVVGIGAPAAHASTSDFSFDSFHADYTLGRDAAGHATLRVVETLVAEFPETDQNHGIERAIPLRDDRTRSSYDMQVRSVADGSGGAVPYSSETRDGFLVLRIGDADRYVHGRQTYVISYTERDVVRHYADTDDDEFYWDVNGTGWDQRFGTVSASLHLTDAVARRATGHTSCYPPTGTCELSATKDGYDVSISDVGPSSTLTIAVGFRAHSFTPGASPDAMWQVAVLPWVLLVALAALLIVVLVVRVRVWRGPRPDIIVPEYEAPDLSPLQAAALLRRFVRGLPAQFVQLTVTGATRLVEDPEAPASSRYRLEVVDRNRLQNAEDRHAFDAILLNSGRMTLDTRDRQLGDRLRALQARERGSLRSQRFLARATSPLTPIAIVAALVLFAAGVYAFITGTAADAATGPLLLKLLGMIVLAVAVIVLAVPPWGLTAKGAAARDRLLGLRMYLQLAEADRLRVLQSPRGAERTRIDPDDPAQVVKLYERLLPWAMVWGIEEQWARVLGEHYATTPPTDDAPFATTSFLAGIGAFSGSMQTSSFAQTVTTSSGSSWSGSGSSGFSGGSSGGGFSGGGGGGGGGGGW
ncbi:DUF2207 domain-containing protein [Pseudolysinimonas sp.]|uniref:DUF2207 domain-containing protein n=1 Tax=Pseudolysinimonas sp. TaxID=2680009 RepID=UPI003F7DD49D